MVEVSPDSEMSTDSKRTSPRACQDEPETCDWETLSGWFLALSLWAEPLLPTALWLVCTCRPSFFQGFRPTASEAELADELAAAVGAERSGGRSRRQPPARPEQNPRAVSWRWLAQALRSVLLAKPSAFRLALWSGVQFVRSVRSELKVDQPAEEEITALLDHLDVSRPDALPIAQRMLASIPGGDAVLARWRPHDWQPNERVVTKIILFFSRVHREAGQGGGEAAGLAAELRHAQWELAGGAGGADLRLAELPATVLHEVEQIIDDPTLAARGKVRAICEALKQATKGVPVAN